MAGRNFKNVFRSKNELIVDFAMLLNLPLRDQTFDIVGGGSGGNWKIYI